MTQEERIRNRYSYKRFAKIARFIVGPKGPKIMLTEGLLTYIHEESDQHNRYGSIKNAEAAKESLEQFLKDMKT